MLNLRKAEREQESGETVMDFIRKASYTFGNAKPHTKMYFGLCISSLV